MQAGYDGRNRSAEGCVVGAGNWVKPLLGRAMAVACVAAALAWPTRSAHALPEIRITQMNRVPACVTPARLMQFLAERNPNVEPKFRNIAAVYEQHGRTTNVRWDYAFFQMIVETNALLFKNASGKGDVSPRQNNFAGIGTTGGGVPGDSFPDVSAGVLGQMQHLIAYSGERVDNPVGRRTRERQDDIIERSRSLKRPVTFRDLARRWAVDGRYGTTIEAVASRFRATYCNGFQPDAPDNAPPERSVVAQAQVAGSSRVPSAPPGAVPAPRVTGAPSACRVFAASYGGDRAILVRAVAGSEWHYTAVLVLEGQQTALAQNFIASHARGGEFLGEFASREAALSRAFALCPQQH